VWRDNNKRKNDPPVFTRGAPLKICARMNFGRSPLPALPLVEKGPPLLFKKVKKGIVKLENNDSPEE